jgi:aminoglycoside 6'-N-acetyltransferase
VTEFESSGLGQSEGSQRAERFVVESITCLFQNSGQMSDYYFRPFTDAELPLVAGWLKTPEVIRWWGEPEHELTVLAQDLDETSMRQWIVEYRGRPFAYVQAHPAGAWPQAHLKHLCADAQMIDAFIGEPDMLGQGHGSGFLRELAQMLIDERSPAVAIDPNAKNERARRAYERAGFAGDEIVNAAEGSVVVMVFRDQQT